MYLEDIILREIQPCTAQGNKIKIKAGLSVDVKELMPYINTVISSSVYNKNMGWLTYRMGEKLITLFGDNLTVTKLLNETDAYETLDCIRDSINDIYDRKTEIIPNDEMKKMPTPLEIYKFLPKKNCKKCGEATCLAFAGKILTGVTQLERCITLENAEYEPEKKELEAILELFGLHTPPQ